ncbi:fam-c protein [Plasmodium vinckei vinckei]|uniref:Fam-c protein n=1 Tax=Plasmodium vinckei vinckei TaxID=54757 RepID=A0A449BM93_PLAVN|nr:fam-c protein [Plasmodium vinckei vinckei]VEV54570.1 fam-c protein [Plasmodium vinckei vinckei]
MKMNRRVFSLVCTVFYALLSASIHFSEQKVSFQTKHKLIYGKLYNSGYLHVVTYILTGKEKNGIESKCETQLNNNNNNNLKNDEDKKNKNRKIAIYYDEKTNLWGYCCCGLWYLFD